MRFSFISNVENVYTLAKIFRNCREPGFRSIEYVIVFVWLRCFVIACGIYIASLNSNELRAREAVLVKVRLL